MRGILPLQGFKMERKNILPDFIAGITLAISLIPDGMAAAILAGVSPAYGLHAVMIAVIAGALFTDSVFMCVATTGAMSVAMGSALAGYGGDFDARSQALFTLVILIGLFQLILGLLRWGSMTRFVSNSVMTGFINGVGVLIILGQLQQFTGYQSSGDNRLQKLADSVMHVNLFNPQAVAVGALTIAIILAFRRTRLKVIASLLSVILMSAVVSLFDWGSVQLVGSISEIPSSLPRPLLPNPALAPDLIVSAIAIGLIGLTQGAGVSRKYPNPDGRFPDPSGDFIGQGIANLASGLFQGMQVGGSVSETALTMGTGARSRWAHIMAGLTIAFVVMLLGGQVKLLAVPCLAGLLIMVGFQIIRIEDLKTVWETNMAARIAMAVTFAGVIVLPIQVAVFLGVVISVLMYVFRQSNAIRLKEWAIVDGSPLPLERAAPAQLTGDSVTILAPYGSLFFAAAPTLEEQFPAVGEAKRAVVILLMRGRKDVGSTFIEIIKRYNGRLRANEGRLMLVGVSDPVYDQLVRTRTLDELGSKNVFVMTNQIGGALNAALKEARSLIH